MAEEGLYDRIARILSISVMLFVAGGILQVLTSLVNILFPATLTSRGVALEQLNAYVAIAVLVALAITAAACGWLAYTRSRWLAHDPRGYRHAKGVAILVVVIGALGILGGIANLPTLRFSDGPQTAVSLFFIAGLCVSIATLLMGLHILRKRGAPEVRAAFPYLPA